MRSTKEFPNLVLVHMIFFNFSSTDKLFVSEILLNEFTQLFNSFSDEPLGKGLTFSSVIKKSNEIFRSGIEVSSSKFL